MRPRQFLWQEQKNEGCIKPLDICNNIDRLSDETIQRVGLTNVVSCPIGPHWAHRTNVLDDKGALGTCKQRCLIDDGQLQMDGFHGPRLRRETSATPISPQHTNGPHTKPSPAPYDAKEGRTSFCWPPQ
jgi:hypothetical protein